MFVFLLILILLAVLGVLGLALKIAAALELGVLIAGATLLLIGYLAVRHQVRKVQRQMADVRVTSSIGETTVEVGDPRRLPEDPPVDDRY
jgi:threonine/homoserine/homoserine lactone efflux protein